MIQKELLITSKKKNIKEALVKTNEFPNSMT